MAHKYTNLQIEFMKDNVAGKTTAQLTELVNIYFGLDLKTSQIRAFLKNNKLRNGVDCKFTKGSTPYNKGKKGIASGGVETQFKKGCRPHNYAPVGSERINGEGYVDIKVAEPNKWKAKHLIVYEHFKGPIPEGRVVIFGDSNNRNFDINNLILVSKQQLLQLNRNNLIKNDAELTKVGVIIADLKIKVAKIVNSNKK